MIGIATVGQPRLPAVDEGLPLACFFALPKGHQNEEQNHTQDKQDKGQQKHLVRRRDHHVDDLAPG